MTGVRAASRGNRISAATGAWLAVVAVDLFINAGLLGDVFTDDDPVLLATADAARRIPVAYAAWALQVVALQWLLFHLDVDRLRPGAWYGACAGFLAGALSVIALWTIVRLDAGLTFAWALAAVAEGATAGVTLVYLARAGRRGWRRVAPAVVLTVAAAFVMQNLR